MSKRRQDTSGAFDALVHAIAGLGASSRWAGLPPATTPGSLGRALGQGVIQTRIPQRKATTRTLNAGPVSTSEMAHEGQRSVAELGAILWRAMDGRDDAPELEPWMEAPHTDPIVALTLSRQRMGEYTRREAIDRSCAFPGQRVWLIDIERAKGDIPAGVAVWQSPSGNDEWRTRCACVWTYGRIGSTTHPLVIGAHWDIDGLKAEAAACVIGPSWDQANHANLDASRNTVLARRQNAIGKQIIARIVVPAVLAWLDHHQGVARPAGRLRATNPATTGDATRAQGAGRREAVRRSVAPVPAAARTPAPPWVTTNAERAVEAIVIGTAREGFRIGASCPVPEWRRGWAGYAEMGASAWHAIRDPTAQIDSETWRTMEMTLGEKDLEGRNAHAALAATSALVRKMLVQTGRNHVARAPDERTLCALEIPARLWRALGEAGPCPEPAAPPDLTSRWWLVEIERPGDEEPNAVALWEEDGSEVALAAFNGVDDGQGGTCLTVMTWRTAPVGHRTRAGLAALRCPIHVDDPDNPESAAGTERIINTLAAPDTGTIARVKTAIALHLASDDEAGPLAPYRRSTPGARTRSEGAGAQETSITALFALKRAPEPKRGDDDASGQRGHGRGGGRRLLARQEVEPHWKRQAYGPRHSRRRWIVIERYERGPTPEDDQIVVTRLPERQLESGARTSERDRRRGADAKHGEPTHSDRAKGNCRAQVARDRQGDNPRRDTAKIPD